MSLGSDDSRTRIGRRVAEPPVTAPTPVPAFGDDEPADDVEPVPAAWGGDPTEWADGDDDADDQPDEFRRY